VATRTLRDSESIGRICCPAKCSGNGGRAGHVFSFGQSEQTTIFSEPEVVEKRLRRNCERDRDIELTVDIARHYHRPSTKLPSGGQNFVFDPAEGAPRELSDYELFRELPLSFSICRIYARDHLHDPQIQKALVSLLGDSGDAKQTCESAIAASG